MSPPDDKRGAGRAGTGKAAGAGRAGGTGGAATRPARRMSREAALALVLLPVLLVAGFVLGGQLLSDDDVADERVNDTIAAATGAPSPEAAAGEPSGPVAGPTLPAETTEAPAGPPVPAEQPATSAPATSEPATPEPGPPPPPAPPPPAPPAAQTGATAPPPLSDPAVTVFGPGQVSEDIRAWQARMAERGWSITVDGIYGPETASVAARFQAEKGLAVDGLVGPETFAAAWQAPITPP